MVDLKAKMEEECKGHGIEGIENRVATIERGRKHIRLQYSVPPSPPTLPAIGTTRQAK